MIRYLIPFVLALFGFIQISYSQHFDTQQLVDSLVCIDAKEINIMRRSVIKSFGSTFPKDSAFLADLESQVNIKIVNELDGMEKQFFARARFYLWLSSTFSSSAENERYLKTALSAIESYGHQCELEADIYRIYGNFVSSVGRISDAHAMFWRAISIYRLTGDCEAKISICFYELATSFLQMSDTDGMNRILAQMKTLADETQINSVYYDYYSVLSAYYSCLIDEQPERTGELLDTLLYYGRQSIAACERMKDFEISLFMVNPVWNYYNMAIFFDFYFSPPLVDSMLFYLDKAENVNKRLRLDRNVIRQGQISIDDARAWVEYYKKNYVEAERMMRSVIQMIDTAGQVSPNAVRKERCASYEFMVQLYTDIGNVDSAFVYQKRLSEANKQLYDSERNQVIKELSIKYETEQKESRIKLLEQDKIIVRRTLILVGSFLILAVVSLLATIIIARLRRKNHDQMYYEQALEKELLQQNLSRRDKRIETLLHKISTLQTISTTSQVEADRYRQDIADMKQQIETASIQNIISKLDSSIENSVLPRAAKQQYTAALQNVDLSYIQNLIAQSNPTLSSLDIKYVLCFVAEMSVPHIADLFNVEVETIYSVRTRIRKKFSKNSKLLPF